MKAAEPSGKRRRRTGLAAWAVARLVSQSAVLDRKGTAVLQGGASGQKGVLAAESAYCSCRLTQLVGWKGTVSERESLPFVESHGVSAAFCEQGSHGFREQECLPFVAVSRRQPEQDVVVGLVLHLLIEEVGRDPHRV